LLKEILPNDRAIEFDYDSAWRLKTVKDPFGFINTVGYDQDGRLGSLSHTTLGTATFDYEDTVDDRLTTLTLGNGAQTVYDYDAHGRLNMFDIQDSSGGRCAHGCASQAQLGL
jgi:YD repeat-containing protein